MLPETVGNSEIESLISGIERRDDNLGHQLLVKFTNGYELSIIANPNFGYGARYAHGDEFEIAVFDPNGDFTKRFFGNHDDYVMGYVSGAEIARLTCEIALT